MRLPPRLGEAARARARRRDKVSGARYHPAHASPVLRARTPMSRRYVVIAAFIVAACGRQPTLSPEPAPSRWFVTWAASPFAGPARPPRDSVDRTPTLFAQTRRLIVRTLIGGDHARIRLSRRASGHRGRWVRRSIYRCSARGVRETGCHAGVPSSH
jgi:hypothetical protein